MADKKVFDPKEYEQQLRQSLTDRRKALDEEEAKIADKLKLIKKAAELDKKIAALVKEKADITAELRIKGMKTGTKGGMKSRPKSVTGEHTSIKQLVSELFATDPEIKYEAVEKAVMAEFPDSAFNKTHFTYYKNA